MRFRKSQRIKSSREFTLILRKGSVAADGVLVLFAIESDDAKPPQLGITIPKKTGNAVARNHWKRLIRESFRTQQDVIPCGYDYVVRPKKGAQASFKAIRKSIPKLARKAVQRMS